MYFVETHKINLNHPFYNEMDDLCFKAKNLYNKANYIIRQEFISTTTLKEYGYADNAVYLNYQDIRRLLIDSDEYKLLPRKVSNQVLMKLDKNWKGFFRSIKEWVRNPQKYLGKPNLPKYLNKKTGRYGLEYELGAISQRALKKGFIKLSKTDISVPFLHKDCKLIQVRIVVITGGYKLETIYEQKEKERKLDNGRHIGADPGVNNLLTLTSDAKDYHPKIVNGRPVKSINQYYNKRLAKYQSELPKGIYSSKKIRKLTFDRNNKIENFFCKCAVLVLKECLDNNINTFIIGKNINWKQGLDIGKENNQKFHEIPFCKLFDKIKYKLAFEGITVIEAEESYTSKASFLNLDEIPTYKKGEENNHKFSGYRESRSWYKIKNQKPRINADVNGSYNIIRKVFPNAFADGIEGFAVIPSVNKIQKRDGKLFF